MQQKVWHNIKEWAACWLHVFVCPGTLMKSFKAFVCQSVIKLFKFDIKIYTTTQGLELH